MSATTILLDSEVLDCIGAPRARELASEWRRGRKLPIRALTRIFLLRTVTSLFIESRLNRRQRHPASLFSTHPPPGHYLLLIEGHLYHYHYCLLCKLVNRSSFSDVPIVLQGRPATNNKWNCGKQRSTLYKRRCKIEFNKQNCTNGEIQMELRHLQTSGKSFPHTPEFCFCHNCQSFTILSASSASLWEVYDSIITKPFVL